MFGVVVESWTRSLARVSECTLPVIQTQPWTETVRGPSISPASCDALSAIPERVSRRSVGVISPQDAVGPEWDVLEN